MIWTCLWSRMNGSTAGQMDFWIKVNGAMLMLARSSSNMNWTTILWREEKDWYFGYCYDPPSDRMMAILLSQMSVCNVFFETLQELKICIERILPTAERKILFTLGSKRRWKRSSCEALLLNVKNSRLSVYQICCELPGVQVDFSSAQNLAPLETFLWPEV